MKYSQSHTRTGLFEIKARRYKSIALENSKTSCAIVIKVKGTKPVPVLVHKYRISFFKCKKNM